MVLFYILYSSFAVRYAKKVFSPNPKSKPIHVTMAAFLSQPRRVFIPFPLHFDCDSLSLFISSVAVAAVTVGRVSDWLREFLRL